MQKLIINTLIFILLINFVIGNNNLSYYPLQDDFTDELGNYDITNTGAYICDEGAFGNASCFDGRDDKGIIDQSSNWLNTTADYSISFWFYHKDIGDSVQRLIWEFAGTSIYIDTPNVIKWGTFATGATDYKEISKNFMPENEWVHVVTTYNESNLEMILYINSSEVDRDNRVSPHDDLTVDIQIGNRDGPDQDFNGSIDEIRFFNKTLEEKEIWDLFNSNKVYDYSCNGTSTFGEWQHDYYNENGISVQNRTEFRWAHCSHYHIYNQSRLNNELVEDLDSIAGGINMLPIIIMYFGLISIGYWFSQTANYAIGLPFLFASTGISFYIWKYYDQTGIPEIGLMFAGLTLGSVVMWLFLRYKIVNKTKESVI